MVGGKKRRLLRLLLNAKKKGQHLKPKVLYSGTFMYSIVLVGMEKRVRLGLVKTKEIEVGVCFMLRYINLVSHGSCCAFFRRNGHIFFSHSRYKRSSYAQISHST